VGRALALLVCDFAYQDGAYEFTLPSPDQAPVFAEHESLYRFLTRATAEAPDARFQTADEMASQLLGILHEEVAGTSEAEQLGPFRSTLFDVDASLGGDLWNGDGRSIRSLPALKLDPLDPGASTILSATSIADPERRLQAYSAAQGALAQRNGSRSGSRGSARSIELPLRIADLLIERGTFADVETQLAELEQQSPYDWRLAWYRGKSLLAQAKHHEALTAFDQVFGEVPGEVAPKLAIALGYELAGDANNAVVYYESVAQTDPQVTAAAFGLARAHLLATDRAAAATALERVSPASIRYTQARLAMARVLLGDEAAPPSAADLQGAAEVLDGLKGIVDGMALHALTADFYQAAAEAVETGRAPAQPDKRLLGVSWASAALRAAAEAELRRCAQVATDRAIRVRYVDLANRVRPRTWR
jgi:serine/threonine-protein kinase PknG